MVLSVKIFNESLIFKKDNPTIDIYWVLYFPGTKPRFSRYFPLFVINQSSLETLSVVVTSLETGDRIDVVTILKDFGVATGNKKSFEFRFASRKFGTGSIWSLRCVSG